MNKKAISELVTNVLIILLVISSISVLWIIFKNISYSPELKCSSLSLGNNFNILNACYLNENEIQLNIKRGVDISNISSFYIVYSNLDSSVKFLIRQKACSDIRLANSEYGRLCSINNPGETKKYIFNMSGEERMSEVNFGVYIEDNLCSVSKTYILDKC